MPMNWRSTGHLTYTNMSFQAALDLMIGGVYRHFQLTLTRGQLQMGLVVNPSTVN